MRVVRIAALCVGSVLVAGCAHLQGSTGCDGSRTAAASGAGTPCLYDPASRTHKECLHVTADGKCAHFGAPCTPPPSAQPGEPAAAPACLYDSASSTYRVCHHVTAGGGCAHFGEPCTATR